MSFRETDLDGDKGWKRKPEVNKGEYSECVRNI